MSTLMKFMMTLVSIAFMKFLNAVIYEEQPFKPKVLQNHKIGV